MVKRVNKEENNAAKQPKAPRKHAFRLSAKSVFLTYPKCSVSKASALRQLRNKKETAYICVSHEKHSDNTDHLHALVQYDEKFITTNQKFFDLEDEEDEEGTIFHGNYQGARDADNVLEYIKKDKDYIEEGIYLSNNASSVQKRAQINKEIINRPLNELVDEGKLSIYNYQQVRCAKMLYTLDSLVVPEYMPKTCYWIVGDTGIGKSRWVRTNCSGFFNKSQNKWWDGYNGEKVVLIDDFDHSGQALGHLLKIWADCYSFSAEIKGGTIKPVIDTFIVTSQYTPYQIWCKGDKPELHDDEMRQAIERRFQMKTIAKDGLTLVDIYAKIFNV